MKISSKEFLWLSIPLFILLTLSFLLPVRPNDYWWYLRLGSEIASTHTVPIIDTFTQTQAGQPMVYHSWLSALLFFWTYKFGGISLTVFLRGLLLSLTYTLLWKMMRARDATPQLASLISFFAILAGSVNWAVRPQLFAYPFFAISLWILIKWDREDGDWRVLGWLPLVSLLWVNLHGSFVFLFLLGGAAYLFGKGERKALFIALVGVFIATLINPRGIYVWEYVVDSLSVISNQAFSREWMPPVNEGWQMNLFFGWILFFMAVAGLSSRKLSLLDWVWILGFGWLAFSGLRYGIWFLFILSILTADLLADWGKPRTRQGIPAMDIAIGAIILLFPLALLPGLRELWWAEAPPKLSADTPVEATQWLKAHPELPGPLWADLAFSSYLVYTLPERPVWIDTRFEVYPPEHWERYQAISSATWKWETLLEEEGSNLLMLSKTEQADLIPALGASSNWDEVYADETSLIFIRNEK
mgnify:CR=1 FL=1